MKKSNSKRPLKFVLRLSKKERADLDQLAKTLMRSRNEAACIAIVYFAQEIAKQGNVSNLFQPSRLAIGEKAGTWNLILYIPNSN